ncbi:MAG: hypothetical protein Q4A74_01525 [Cardiobacteriaceae bacterium]|nr:hypothetical protein [Cardiobacteriaceae bacterium]
MKYDVVPKARRKVLWQRAFAGDVEGFDRDDFRQVLTWHQLWRRGQALVPMLPPCVVGAAIDAVLGGEV